jgi:Domain of unknown function (DUF4387)
MSRLREIASIVRSKNAGPLYLTLDVMLPDRATFQRVVASGALGPDRMSRLYAMPAAEIEVIEHSPTYTIKVTMRRAITAGDPADTDLYGAQQYVPLLEIEVPD